MKKQATQEPVTMSHDLLKTLRTEVNAVLTAIASKHGVIMDVGNASFDPMGGTAKFALNVAVVHAGQEGKNTELIKAEAAFTRSAPLYGMKSAWLGRSAKRFNGDRVTVLGLMPQRRKYPVLCAINGRQRLLTTREIIALFGGKIK